MISFDYHDNFLKIMRILNKKFEIYKFQLTKRNQENKAQKQQLEGYGPLQKRIISIKNTKNDKIIYL